MTRIKICGITNSRDALNAIAAGADWLGFIFVDSSARKIDEVAAKAVIEAVGGRAKTVAVFRNSPIEDVKRIAQNLKFDYVQLHGSESPEFCRSVAAPVIKVVEIAANVDVAELARLLDSYDFCDYILFDKPKDLDFSDWLVMAIERVGCLNLKRPYFFAGGLNYANVVEVVTCISPFGVDVASGVESAPGVKEIEKMNAFCGAVRDTAVDRANVVNEAIS